MQVKNLLGWYATTWIASVTRLSFFRELPKRPLKSAIGFALVSYILFFFAQTTFFSNQNASEFQSFVVAIQQAAENDKELLASVQTVLPFLFFISLMISRTIFLLLETTLLYFVLKIFHQPQKFVQLIKLTLHILVLAELINQWSQIVLPQATFSMLSLSFWVLLVVVLLQQQKQPNRQS